MKQPTGEEEHPSLGKVSWLMTVGDRSTQQFHQVDEETAMTRVLNLRDVLELVVDRPDDGPLAQQQLVRQGHQAFLDAPDIGALGSRGGDPSVHR